MKDVIGDGTAGFGNVYLDRDESLAQFFRRVKGKQVWGDRQGDVIPREPYRIPNRVARPAQEYVDPNSAAGVYKAGQEELEQFRSYFQLCSNYNLAECEKIRRRIAEKAKPYHEARMREISEWARNEASKDRVSPIVRRVWDEEIRDKIRHGRKRPVHNTREGSKESRYEDRADRVQSAPWVDIQKPIPVEEWFGRGFSIEEPYVPKLKGRRITDGALVRSLIDERWKHPRFPAFRSGPKSDEDKALVSALVDVLAQIQSEGATAIHPTAVMAAVGCKRRTAQRLLKEGVEKIKTVIKAPPITRGQPPCFKCASGSRIAGHSVCDSCHGSTGNCGKCGHRQR